MSARLLCLSSVLALWLTACGDEQAGGDMPRLANTTVAPLGCEPTEVRQCPCLHGGTGMQSCLQTGDAYGPCSPCPVAPTPPMDDGTSDAMDAMDDPGGLDAADAGMADAGMGDAGSGDDPGEGPTLDPILPGTSCGVGLPVTCELDVEKCCTRSLRTDTCIGVAESCTCDLPDCTVMESHCDGPEDCPDGQVCCGTLVGGSRYERFECVSSCDFAGTQRIACHQADPQCPAGNECANSQLLTNLQVCIDPETIRQ
ncbi:MAG: hypothetical protein OXT09_18740 [Myxococcales bacterium]|nr:hypothetical protein [Myxococcales bacterium]